MQYNNTIKIIHHRVCDIFCVENFPLEFCVLIMLWCALKLYFWSYYKVGNHWTGLDCFLGIFK